MSFFGSYSPIAGGGGGGGGGITSINSDTTAAQTIAAGTGISVVSLAGTTTITNTSPAAATGNLTDVGTDGIVITGGTGAVIGSGTSLAQHVADSTHNGYLSSTDWSTFNAKQAALTIGNLTDVGTDGITVTGGTGAVIGSGTSISQHVADSTHNGYLSSTDWSTFNGKQASGNYITALTGDGTASGPGSVALTLATVNSNVGSFGSSTAIPSFTVNAKGLVTAASTNVVIAPAGTLTGTTLASNVVTSSLTTVGTIGTGIWQGTAVGATYGGTGGNSSAATGIAHVASGTWSYSAIVNADVDAAAAIAQTKLAGFGTVAKTANYTVTSTDDFLTGDSSGGTFTFTLQSASARSGKPVVFTKIDTSFTAITITDGTLSTTLNTNGESVTVLSNGTAYRIVSRYIPSTWTTYTMTIGGTTSAPTPGSGATNEARWRREGDSVCIIMNYEQANAGSNGSGAYLFPLPSGLSVDTAKMRINTHSITATQLGVGGNCVGMGTLSTALSGDANYANILQISIYDSSTLNVSLVSGAALTQGFPFGSSTNTKFSVAQLLFTFFAKVSVSGWNG